LLAGFPPGFFLPTCTQNFVHIPCQLIRLSAFLVLLFFLLLSKSSPRSRAHSDVDTRGWHTLLLPPFSLFTNPALLTPPPPALVGHAPLFYPSASSFTFAAKLSGTGQPFPSTPPPNLPPPKFFFSALPYTRRFSPEPPPLFHALQNTTVTTKTPPHSTFRPRSPITLFLSIYGALSLTSYNLLSSLRCESFFPPLPFLKNQNELIWIPPAQCGIGRFFWSSSCAWGVFWQKVSSLVQVRILIFFPPCGTFFLSLLGFAYLDWFVLV